MMHLMFLSSKRFLMTGLVVQIPKRLYTLEELRLNNLKPEEFLSPEDSTLNTVRTILQVRCILIALACCIPLLRSVQLLVPGHMMCKHNCEDSAIGNHTLHSDCSCTSE